MKSLLTIIFLISLLGGGLHTITHINQYTKIAALAYEQQEYAEAIAAYEYILTDLEVKDDQLRLNLGHTYFRAGQLQQAQQQYTQLAKHTSKHIRAVALLQLGNITAQSKKYKQALVYYRQALVADPASDAARYNYELLKKYLALHPDHQDAPDTDAPAAASQDQEQGQHQPDNFDQTPPPDEEQQAPKPKNKPDSTGDQEEEIESQEQADKGQDEQQGSGSDKNQPNDGNSNRPENQDKQEASGQEKGDTKGLNPDNAFDPDRPERSQSNDPATDSEQRVQTRNNRLQQMNISPQKAKLILDAMRNAEQQYIQQLPRKATGKPDSLKPDW
ncbi:aerotolerance protein [Pontibacter sp. HJ8]